MDVYQILREKRAEIIRIADSHGARNVRLFGSVARSQAGEDSDIDILVSLEPDRSLLDLAALALDLEKALGREVDVVSDRGIKPRICERVLSEAVPL